jgi:RNA polymerase sigma factor (sigma-70 family)
MPTDRARGVVQVLRRAALLPGGGGPADRDLLEEFIARQDEAAFEAIVRRHGPMVLGVCRRVLGHRQDAEDAFQATFVVLARKASSIRKRDDLGNWLYGVAYRTALDARRARMRRRAKERQVEEMPHPSVEGDEHWHDLRPVLDQELSRLPDKYRVPVVLCDLEGKTRKDVARQLGIPEATLSNRLAAARRLLARRLTRRGVTLAAGAVAACLTPSVVSARVPPMLIRSTVKAATGVAAGGAAALSAKVAALSDGVLKAMLMTKLKIAGTTLLVALASCFAGGFLYRIQAAGGPPQREVTGAAGDAPAPRASPVWKIGPTLEAHKGPVYAVAFSCDGKRMATGSADKTVMVWDLATRETVRTFTHATMVGAVAYAPDGKTLAAASGNLLMLWDLETGKERAILRSDAPVYSAAFSADGKTLAWATGKSDGSDREVRFWDMAAGKDLASIKAGWVAGMVLSPSGPRFATLAPDRTLKLWQLDEKLALTKKTSLGEASAVSFSPDGKLLAAATGSENAVIFDVESGKAVRSLKHQGFVQAVAFSLDGKTLATGSVDSESQDAGTQVAGGVAFWDVATGKRKQYLSGNLAPILSMAFAPNGRTVALRLQGKAPLPVSKDGTILSVEQGVLVLCELK